MPRTPLALACLLLLAGCSSGSAHARPAPTPQPSARPTASPTTQAIAPPLTPADAGDEWAEQSDAPGARDRIARCTGWSRSRADRSSTLLLTNTPEGRLEVTADVVAMPSAAAAAADLAHPRLGEACTAALLAGRFPGLVLTQQRAHALPSAPGAQSRGFRASAVVNEGGLATPTEATIVLVVAGSREAVMVLIAANQAFPDGLRNHLTALLRARMAAAPGTGA